jgi:hypothetical protein
MRQVEILSIDEMSVQSGIDPTYLRALVFHKQLQPLVHARSMWVQDNGDDGVARAKQAARDHQSFVPQRRWQSAKETFANFLKSPAGMDRFKSTNHRREMENLKRGYPANYTGPLGEVIKPLQSDEFMADVAHKVEKREDGSITAAVHETLGIEPPESPTQMVVAEDPPKKRIPGIS